MNFLFRKMIIQFCFVLIITKQDLQKKIRQNKIRQTKEPKQNDQNKTIKIK